MVDCDSVYREDFRPRLNLHVVPARNKPNSTLQTRTELKHTGDLLFVNRLRFEPMSS